MKKFNMRFFYSLAYSLALPFLLFSLIRKKRKTKNATLRLAERFGFYQKTLRKKGIWVHAVSLGETIAVKPLVEKLIAAFPEFEIILTHSTAAADVYVQENFQNKVECIYLPFDLRWCVRRFLRHFQPKIGVIMETELWPNLLAVCRSEKINLVLANARISPRTFTRYQKIPKTIGKMLNSFTCVLAQTSADLERMEKLGLEKSKGEIVGNIKFDLIIPEKNIADGKTLRTHSQNRPVLIAASTHKGEEEIILSAFKMLLSKISNALLILVPRHSTRFDEVAALCRAQKFSMVRRSAAEIPDENTQIFLGDSMGEMGLFYTASDIAFVGGSLVPIGGHNLLEPAALGLPVLSGPFLQNQVGMRDLLLSGDGLMVVKNAEELAAEWMRLIFDPQDAKNFGERAKNIMLQNRGALEKHIQKINFILNG